MSFFQELCMLQSSNTAYLRRMTGCIVELRLKLIALLFHFSPFFFFPLFRLLTLKMCVIIFSGTVQARHFIFR